MLARSSPAASPQPAGLDLGPCPAVIYRADPLRTAIVLPGVRYPPAAPLLWFAREAMLAAGWTVLEVWDPLEDATAERVIQLTEAALDHAGERVAIVAKSESSRAASLAADRDLPGIWITPDLSDPAVAAALVRLQAPGLVVGSLADPTWRRGISAQLRKLEVLQLAGADHELQVPGDTARSLQLLDRVVDRYRALIGRLG